VTAVAGVGSPSGRGRAASIVWETELFASPAAVATRPSGRPGSGTDASRSTRTATVDDLVDEARAAYDRMSARAAYQAALHGRAVIVDIRPAAQRAAEGEVHPALRPVVVERNVLEWRLDPRSPARLPWVDDQSRVVVLCQEGYASSLAAASLARLGLQHATDVVGGLAAWRAAGLPVA